MRRTIKPLSAGLLAVIFMAGLAYYFIRLPHPSVCSTQQLGRWLAKSGLENETRDTLSALVDRFQQDLEGGLLDGGRMDSLSASLRQRVHQNIGLLQKVWFQDRVTQFHGQEPTTRAEFLDRQIATIENWPKTGGNELQFFSLIDQWMAEANEDERQKMNEAIVASIVRWLETYDLRSNSKQVRQTLARRIDEYLSRGKQVSGQNEGASDSEREMLRQNALTLMQSWFVAQSDHFHSLAEGERGKFVTGKLKDVRNWDLSGVLGGKSDSNQLLAVVQRVDAWISQAPPEKQPELKEFKQAVSQAVWDEMFGAFDFLKSGPSAAK